MTLRNLAKPAAAGTSLAVVVLMGMLISSPRGRAQNGNGNGNANGANEVARIQQGFAISPVKLNLTGKSPTQINQVGLGSYLVNAVGDCDGCHTSGGPPNFNYLAGYNPYFLFPKGSVIDPSTYLAGGTDFGPAIPFTVGPGVAYGSYVGPDIISRNLTPDKNGLPEGGKTLAQFEAILRTGVDMDGIHPTCTSPSPTPTPANCIPPPVDGSRLQVMPWPVFHNLSDNDIEAIYEYLSTIPCIDNKTSTPPAGAPNELRNNCGQ
jgi:hypothetical protein